MSREIGKGGNFRLDVGRRQMLGTTKGDVQVAESSAPFGGNSLAWASIKVGLAASRSLTTDYTELRVSSASLHRVDLD